METLEGTLQNLDVVDQTGAIVSGAAAWSDMAGSWQGDILFSAEHCWED